MTALLSGHEATQLAQLPNTEKNIHQYKNAAVEAGNTWLVRGASFAKIYMRLARSDILRPRQYHFNPRILIEVNSRIYQSPTRLYLNISSTARVSPTPRGNNGKYQSLFHHSELGVAGIELKAIFLHLAVSIANLDFDMQLLPEGPIPPSYSTLPYWNIVRSTGLCEFTK